MTINTVHDIPAPSVGFDQNGPIVLNVNGIPGKEHWGLARTFVYGWLSTWGIAPVQTEDPRNTLIEAIIALWDVRDNVAMYVPAGISDKVCKELDNAVSATFWQLYLMVANFATIEQATYARIRITRICDEQD